MKYCEECGAELKTNARFCEKCGKSVGQNSNTKQKKKMPTWAIVLIVIFGFIFLGVISGDSEPTEETKDNETTKTETTKKEDLELLAGHKGYTDGEYTYEISGTIKNNKDREYSYVSVEFYTYDKDGNMLDTCLANNSGLEPNGTWKFEATCWFGNGNSRDVASYKLKEITKW